VSEKSNCLNFKQKKPKVKFFSRKCYMEMEKKLKFFKYFTKNNCKHECLSNKTVESCGCAQFYMVRDKHVKVCGVKEMVCYKKVELDFEKHNAYECYPACGEINYNFETILMDSIRLKT
jgi:acid-sensing ion channel, other